MLGPRCEGRRSRWVPSPLPQLMWAFAPCRLLPAQLGSEVRVVWAFPPRSLREPRHCGCRWAQRYWLCPLPWSLVRGAARMWAVTWGGVC